MMAAVITTIGFLFLGLVLWAGFKIQDIRLKDEDVVNGHGSSVIGEEEDDEADETLEAQRIAQEAFRDI